MKQHEKIDIATFKQRLLDRRKELEKLIESSHEETNPVEIDQDQVGLLSRMEAMEEHAVAEEVEHWREVELKRIALALERIEHGEYGYCTSCGESIEKKRLELDPSAPLCFVCASV